MMVQWPAAGKRLAGESRFATDSAIMRTILWHGVADPFALTQTSTAEDEDLP